LRQIQQRSYSFDRTARYCSKGGDSNMAIELRPLNRILRRALLITVFIVPYFTGQGVIARTTVQQSSQSLTVSQDVLDRLGIQRPQAADLTELSLQVAHQVEASGLPESAVASQQPEVGGLPNNLYQGVAQSAAIMTLLNSNTSSNYRDVMMMGDLDGREDLVADHAGKLADLSTSNLPAGWMLTRAAMSEHTSANGFSNSVYYYGDSLGNVYVGVDTNTGFSPAQVVTYTVLNLPTTLNAFGTLNSDDQIVITGLGVNPVADLTSFYNVNSDFSAFNGKIGEILYVAFWDTGGGLRLTGNNKLIQSGVLAFPIADGASPAYAPPGIQSHAGFPVTVGGSFGVAFSVYANLAGLAVDDNGDIYFQQVDLTDFTGANIVKITSVDKPGEGGFQDRSLATNGFATLTTLTPLNGIYGTPSGPAKQVSQVTNYSGTSPTFGNSVALAAGPNNILYAAVARSFESSDPAKIQNTEGLFTNPPDLGATPSMIISFSDTTGAFDLCTGVLSSTFQVTGTLPVADGFADMAQSGLALEAGVNNFRAFVLGDGPDVRGTLVGATLTNTLRMDFQVDATIFSGLSVDQESKVYLIAGGTPQGIGRDPSPLRSEILVFPDQQLFDRRADFVDLRGDVLPDPTTTSGNLGDGQSDRFDHLYYQAPLDQVSLTPIGLSGLSGGFLLYLNRPRNAAFIPTLPYGHPQGDDGANGPINFEDFDPSHQVAGGDDQYFPYRGDDNDSGGSPSLASPLNGGFEFVYRQYMTTTQTLVATAWNAFYLNSNGSLTFGQGDGGNIPTSSKFLTGLPRLAGAWTDLDPGSAWQYGNFNTFPVQALGFAAINHFIARWINTPSFGYESCNSSNSFSISLYDDGTGEDENANQPLNPANPIGNNAVPFDLNEGPTEPRFYSDGIGQFSAIAPRPDQSGNQCFTYGRMDLLGSKTAGDAVLVGVTPGLQPVTTTVGINLSAAALAGDAPFPSQLGIGMGDSIPASPYEWFTTGVRASFIVTNGITTTFAAQPAFDLRLEGNDATLSTPVNQPDPNRGQVCFHNLSSQAITFDALPDRGISDFPFSVSATASSGLPVTFTASGQCTATGTMGSTISGLGTGSCTVTAHQAGNTKFAPAPDVAQTFQISLTSQTITFHALPDRRISDFPFKVSATASSGLPVTFTASGQCKATGTTGSKITALGAGSCTVTAQQAGNSEFDPAPDVARKFQILYNVLLPEILK
jgi:hypothetical protein